MSREMLAVLLLEIVARRRCAHAESLLDRVLRRVVRTVCASELREVEADVRQELDGGIEQHRAFDVVRVERRELEHEPPAERVTDPVRATDAGAVERLEQVVDVRVDRPRRLPLRRAVATQVGGEHVEAAGEPLFGELAVAAAVRADAVDADDRRRVGVAPLVQLQQHYRLSAPASAGIAASQWMIAPTSASASIDASPWFTAATTPALTKP